MSLNYLFPRLNTILRHKNIIHPVLNQFRNSSYQNSKIIENIEEFNSKYEITKNAEDWKYVERILAPKIVPEPEKKSEYASGWAPQAENVSNEKYFVQRNKNFMIPVYLESSYRGMRKITKIRRIHGDVFQLESDLKKYIEDKLQKEIATQTNELVGYVHLKGDFVSLVKEYLLKKGF